MNFHLRVGLLLEHRAFGETSSLFLSRSNRTVTVPISFTFTLCICLLRCTGSGARFREPLLIYFVLHRLRILLLETPLHW